MHGTELTWKERLVIAVIVTTIFVVFFLAVHWRAIFG
jgi:hypothetical protein